MQNKVLILDFGSQVTQLIARRVRELNIYCEIHPYNSEKFNFSENFFDLPINGQKTVSVQLDSFSDIDAIIKSIQLRSLWDSRR